MSNHRSGMRLAHTRRPKWAWTFRDGGVRKIHSRNDTEYLLSSPANAKRIFEAMGRMRAWDEILFGKSDLPTRAGNRNDAAA